MKKKGLFIIVNVIVYLLLLSCTGNKQGHSAIDNRQRQEIIDEIEKMQPHLPIQVPNTPLTLSGANVDDDMIVFVASLPTSLFEDMAFGAEVANSDKNVARMLNNVNQEQLDKFIKAGFGLKYIYKSSDTDETLLTIEADCDRLKRVKEGVASGEIVPYTALEIFQMEIDRYEFPCEIEEGVWMTDGYIKGNTVYYVATLESDITSEDLSYSDIIDMKQGILEGLKETLVGAHKKEMAQKGIRVIYVYKNNNGDEFARVELTADDL